MLSASYASGLEAEAARPLRPGAKGEPLGIAAGGGSLPRIVVEAAEANGWSPRILAVGDGIDVDWSPYQSLPMPWGRLADGLRWLQGARARKLVLCGTISARPDFRSLVPSFRTLLLMRQILAVVRGGDDNLLRAAANAFAARGFEVVSVQAIAPALLAPLGAVAGSPPTGREAAAMERGFSAARTLGALDIGQAVVASDERVIALEGIEGTREMLERVADLRRRGRIGRNEPCVLVKRCKPGQDVRFDLPSIGVSTVEEAAAAGLVGVAVSARRTLILGLEDVQAAARSHGLFLVGADPDSGVPA